MKENSIEKDIEIVENLLSNAHVDYEEYYKQIEIGDISFNAIKNLLSNYKIVLKENKELKEEKINNYTMIALAQNETLGYMQGYEDGKNSRTSAVAIMVENQQYYIIKKQLEKDKEHIERLQKENQNLKENYAEYVKKSCETINKKLKENYISVCNLYDIIKKLKIYNNEDNEKVKMYENIRRNISNNFYRKSHQTFIHKLNAQIRVRKQVILLLNKLLNTKK